MSIWRSERTVEDLNANRHGTLIETLGILFTEVGADFVRGTMPVDTRTAQPYGLLHGGASVALAETLGSMGAAMCVAAEEYQVVGQEINANHVRAARSGLVTGTARPVHIWEAGRMSGRSTSSMRQKSWCAFRASPWR